MVWLVVVQRLICKYGGTPVLAAGFAEALPLAPAAVNGVVSLDVIEHVGDQVAYLREIDRVTVPGGAIARSTPNRYSLAAEPHVHVRGVGWLPRRWQQRYAEWRSGQSYANVRLLSTREMRLLLALHTGFQARILIPPIPEEEIATARPRRALLARAYNGIVRSRSAVPSLVRSAPSIRLPLARRATGRRSEWLSASSRELPLD